jgi:hypothetical protein
MSVRTIIEIRPSDRWKASGSRWKVFEAPGVEPVFETMKAAIQYAKTRTNFRAGEIRIHDKARALIGTITFDETAKTL